MNYRHLGKAGIQLSELSFGSWVTFHNQAGVDATVAMMSAAYGAGVNFFDNAEAYAGGKSEEIMGAALKKLAWRRGSYLISTKLFWGLHEGPNERNTLNHKYLLEAIDGSLVRLGTDYVDLLLCHRADPSTPVEETVWAMHNIIERGKALYWGTSEWEAADIVTAIETAERHHLHKPVVEQPVYNLFEQHRLGPDYKAVYEEHRLGSTTWSPSRLAKVSALEPLAADMGATLAQFSLAWCLQNPYVSTVLTGASRVEQVRENMKALNFVDRFTPEIMNEIQRIFCEAG
jgi:aryl-alcohol dehydrogenase-like predicted oxidoreductase